MFNFLKSMYEMEKMSVKSSFEILLKKRRRFDIIKTREMRKEMQ